jgi:hypothetical protein
VLFDMIVLACAYLIVGQVGRGALWVRRIV